MPVEQPTHVKELLRRVHVKDTELLTVIDENLSRVYDAPLEQREEILIEFIQRIWPISNQSNRKTDSIVSDEARNILLQFYANPNIVKDKFTLDTQVKLLGSIITHAQQYFEQVKSDQRLLAHYQHLTKKQLLIIVGSLVLAAAATATAVYFAMSGQLIVPILSALLAVAFIIYSKRWISTHKDTRNVLFRCETEWAQHLLIPDNFYVGLAKDPQIINLNSFFQDKRHSEGTGAPSLDTILGMQHQP